MHWKPGFVGGALIVASSLVTLAAVEVCLRLFVNEAPRSFFVRRVSIQHMTRPASAQLALTVLVKCVSRQI